VLPTSLQNPRPRRLRLGILARLMPRPLRLGTFARARLLCLLLKLVIPSERLEGALILGGGNRVRLQERRQQRDRVVDRALVRVLWPALRLDGRGEHLVFLAALGVGAPRFLGLALGGMGGSGSEYSELPEELASLAAEVLPTRTVNCPDLRVLLSSCLTAGPAAGSFSQDAQMRDTRPLEMPYSRPTADGDWFWSARSLMACSTAGAMGFGVPRGIRSCELCLFGCI
jgi:hypothetical protein